jgi:hypothetical protein
MTRCARILPGPRCGGPDACTAKSVDHSPEPGTRRIWTFHDVQCQAPNPQPQPNPHLDGDPERGLTDLHAGGHDHRRQGATATLKEPEPEAGL